MSNRIILRDGPYDGLRLEGDAFDVFDEELKVSTSYNGKAVYKNTHRLDGHGYSIYRLKED